MVCDSLSFCVVKGLVADDAAKTLPRDKCPSWMDGPWWLNSLLDPLGDACGRVFFLWQMGQGHDQEMDQCAWGYSIN